jgi:hypothetical protein
VRTNESLEDSLRFFVTLKMDCVAIELLFYEVATAHSNVLLFCLLV